MPRDNNPSHLHPLARDPILRLAWNLQNAAIPLALYEGWRSPERQAQLFVQGRGVGTPGRHVTRAGPWRSFHNHGFAADFVFFVDGKWTWNEPAPGLWRSFDELARGVGLHRLDFEQPHVELDGTHLSQLQAGVYPPGDDGWRWNLEAAIERWGAQARTVDGLVFAGAPPMQCDRPPLTA